MIEKGVRINQSTLHNAIKTERLDLSKLFTREADERLNWDANEALEVARNTENEKIVGYMEKWFRSREKWSGRQVMKQKRMSRERT